LLAPFGEETNVLLQPGIKQRFIDLPALVLSNYCIESYSHWNAALGARSLSGGHGKEIITFIGCGTELFFWSGRGKFEFQRRVNLSFYIRRTVNLATSKCQLRALTPCSYTEFLYE
jgi:hypothetical protein